MLISIRTGAITVTMASLDTGTASDPNIGERARSISDIRNASLKKLISCESSAIS